MNKLRMAKTKLAQSVSKNKGRQLSPEYTEMDDTLTMISKMYDDLSKQVKDCNLHSGHLAGYGIRVSETMEAFSTVPGFGDVIVFSEVQKKQMDFITGLANVMEEILMEGIKEVQQEIEAAKQMRKTVKNDKLAVDTQDNLVAKYREKQNMEKLPGAQTELDRLCGCMEKSEEGFIYMVNALMHTHARVYGAVMQQYFISVKEQMEKHIKILSQTVDNFEPIQFSFSGGSGGVGASSVSTTTSTTSMTSSGQDEEVRPSAPPQEQVGGDDGEIVTAAYDFQDDGDDSMNFSKGAKLKVLQKSDSGWWLGENMATGEKGWFPSNFVE